MGLLSKIVDFDEVGRSVGKERCFTMASQAFCK